MREISETEGGLVWVVCASSDAPEWGACNGGCCCVHSPCDMMVICYDSGIQGVVRI